MRRSTNMAFPLCYSLSFTPIIELALHATLVELDAFDWIVHLTKCVCLVSETTEVACQIRIALGGNAAQKLFAI